MAYDEDLADRIRVAIGNAVDVDGLVTEKRMFGGLAFLLGGNMAVAASGQGGLMLRVDPDETETLLAQPHAAPMEMRGREMAGWLRVGAAGVDSDEDLRRWVEIGLTRAGSLPPK
ncbi:TfoX/Sxy family protein [Marmoricola sp. URHB0036]|uniref:TfoX/Sxy family protein n=1 Tax=Marmoricola sp. URHB0036 TaxID=1298863 RepID=UPI000409D962|nr:TfoX/Sxy family protein [Marmoricola sp. URHB0036]